MRKLFALFIVCLLVISSVALSSCQMTALDRMKKELNNDFSFDVSFMYMNLAKNGVNETMKQATGKDGSFYYLVEWSIWDHDADYEKTEKNEFYYRYEENVFYCYMKDNNGKISKQAISKSTEQEMKNDKKSIVGANAIFPSYIESFEEVEAYHKYKFSLPIDQVLKDNIHLSIFLDNVFGLSGVEYDETLNLKVVCNIETEEDTYRPIRVSYDFSELKPYVLSNFALEGEGALDKEFMYMTYEFDYNLEKSIQVPSEFQK